MEDAARLDKGLTGSTRCLLLSRRGPEFDCCVDAPALDPLMAYSPLDQGACWASRLKKLADEAGCTPAHGTGLGC